MSTTLNNILGVSGKSTAPYTPPGIDSSLPGATGTQTRQSTTGTPPAKPEAPTPQEASAALKEATPQVTDVEKTQIEVKPQRVSYEEMFRLLNPYKPPTQEELEKERKKQRREQIFAAIGDGISALSNLFFTTQYAPNMYRPVETQSEKTKKRWDKLTAERNANMTAYINGLMRARQADDTYNDNERAWQRQLGLDKIKQERDKAADARAEAKEKRDAEMHDLNKQLRNNQITQAEYEAKKAEVEARYAPQLEQSKINRNKAAAGASNASASASRARARYYDNGGSSGNRYYGEFQGKKYKTQADYEKAVLDAARDAGVDIYDTEVTERNYKGEPRKQRRVKRSIAAIAAEVDEKTNQFNVDDYRRGGGTGNSNSAPPLN
ncbi:hypothetical protein QVO32_03260 [Bacteroides gallinaceum]|uniref:hypothetical protein n=1 Tax=Bacteroides gallinaceum TaxID=1462571 RepID=UPI0025AB3795|nr:hypothetical protein [Bacteroides gallinaceum]MDN0078431.1 hypothetical protein [Bacteroides gallinaceum]